MRLSLTENPENGINPVVLFQRHVRYDRENDSRFGVKLLTADNKPFPYYIVQLYQGDDPERFILNFALYPDQSVFDQIESYMLTGLDFIIGGLNTSVSAGHRTFNVSNGQAFLDMLFANQEGFEKLIGSELDAVYRGWVMAKRALKGTNNDITD